MYQYVVFFRKHTTKNPTIDLSVTKLAQLVFYVEDDWPKKNVQYVSYIRHIEWSMSENPQFLFIVGPNYPILSR